MFGVGIPHYKVGVAANSDRTFARVESEHLGWRRRDDLHPAVERDAFQVHTVVEKKLKPVLNTGSAVGNLGKTIAPHFLLLFEAERAMVRRDNL